VLVFEVEPPLKRGPGFFGALWFVVVIIVIVVVGQAPPGS
jgi:hypothetical protein